MSVVAVPMKFNVVAMRRRTPKIRQRHARSCMPPGLVGIASYDLGMDRSGKRSHRRHGTR